jgi:hypothetical protein
MLSGSPTQNATSVADLATLRGLDDTPYKDGELAYVVAVATYYRVNRLNNTGVPTKSGNGTWTVYSQGSSAAPTIVSFSPGNPAPSLGEYTSWPALVVAANQGSSDTSVFFDDTYAPVVVPAGTWAFTKSPTWTGNPTKAQVAQATTVTFADGCLITGVNQFANLQLVSTSTSSVSLSPVGVPAIYSFYGFMVLQASPVAIFDHNQPQQLVVYVNDFSEFEQGVAGSAVFNTSVAGAVCTFITNASGLIDAHTISGIVGSTYFGRIGNAQGAIVLPQDTPSLTVAFGEQSIYIQYVPAVVANWSGVAPSSVNNALDRIAAKVGPIA